ncbi:MAG: type restriction enzyme protein, partial [Pseudomonadota bacterium]|nr:type restriction enzyme protein [Pseudomonadota bacterium]
SPDESLHFSITSQEYQKILAGHSNHFEDRINQLFNGTRQSYLAFSSDSVLRLKPLTLAYIVERLQFISLINTPGDVKGEAFQAFVYKNQRGDRGEFFTPHPVVKLAVEMIAPRPGEKVIDPACGSGGFLIKTINYVLNQNPDIDKTTYISECIHGIEFNPDVALSAMIRLEFEGGLGQEIECANSLIKNQAEIFDIVLTNPPFGNKGKVENPKILKNYVLAKKWHKKSDRSWEITSINLPSQSPDILFIEKCLNLLRPGGRIAIVLPDGILQNVSNSPVRFWIQSQAKVLGVISIPQEAFVPYGTGIKTSLLVLQKYPALPTSHLFMAQIRKLGYDVKGQPVYQRNSQGRLLKTASGDSLIDDDLPEIALAYQHFIKTGQPSKCTENIYFLDEKSLNSRLDVEHYYPEDLQLLEQLEIANAKSLGDIATILNGTADFRQATDREIRYIAISDVDARSSQVIAQHVIQGSQAPSRAAYLIRTGDIITACSGASTGTAKQATALITDEEDGAICSNGFAVIRNIHGVKPLFLLAYMRTERYLRQVRRLMTGHAIPAISSDDLSKILVPIPDPAEQEKIATAMAHIQILRREAIKASELAISDTDHLITRLLIAH